MKKLFTLLATLIGLNTQAAEQEGQFPPVPKWQPDFSISVDQVLERMVYYFDDGKDIVIFENGTAVVLSDSLNDAEAEEFALKTLSDIYNYHPDMNPINMDDGNILVQYNHPAFNVVINSFANNHMVTIKKRHLDALATSEVLITSLGNNVFDEFGMKVLYGRTFMFMDAQNPKIVKIYRHKSSSKTVSNSLENGKEESQKLFDSALPFAKNMLAENGEFFPYGEVMMQNNEIVSIGAQIEDDDQPSSSELITLLKSSFIKAGKAKEYKATAIIYDAVVKLPSSNKKSDAIAVDLDHEKGYSVIVFVPYTINKDAIEFGEMFVNKGRSAIFADM